MFCLFCFYLNSISGPDVPRKLKRNRLDFDDCQVEIDSVSQNLVQISADEKEIIRRIQCFVEKKREEIDLNNIRDFTTTNTRVNDETVKEDAEEVFSCARTNGIFIKQVDSKGHLRGIFHIQIKNFKTRF